MPLFRTLIVDDDDIVREVLTIRLSADDRLQIVGAVATGEQAISAAERLQPDLIALDLCLPGLCGIDTMRCLIELLPQVRILVLSATQSSEQVRHAFATGAKAYVFKPSSGTDLPEAIGAVIAGSRYVSPAVRPNVRAGGTHIPLPA